jgi:hypothetical protein
MATSGIVTDSERRAAQVWNWCYSSFSKVGHILRFPKHTDPQKTYQWRYVTKLAQTLEEWDFDDDTSQVFIDHVAAYAKEKRLLNKGLSICFQSNILQVCHDRLSVSDKRAKSGSCLLEQTKAFLDNHRIKGSILKGLLDRSTPDAFFNIVTWYDAGEIPKLFMALSKSCTNALSKIGKVDQDQRSMLPTRSELFILASDFASNPQNRKQAEEILGKDWREMCR